MKPPAFTYHSPDTLSEALALLEQLGDEAKILAGGQSLVPLMNFRLAAPANLIDINGLAELSHVSVDRGVLRLGALTRHRELERTATIGQAAPLLAEAAPFIGHPQIRSMGTLGGSLAHADPAAELPGVVLALGATILAHSARGERAIPATEFFSSHFTTVLEPDELVVAVELPALPPRTGHAFTEVAARHGDFALAGAAAAVTTDSDGAITEARIAGISVAPVPVRLSAAEKLLRGAKPGPAVLSELEELVAGALEPTPELKASSDYKRRTAGVLAARAVDRAWHNAHAPAGSTERVA
ncbi:MAG: xanthine dehydrogenase family protein subunit M [Pseudonocardia sp.]|nr:xanthine dehydrogenase family protein subunit M [Pseudonocardia sp.]